MIRREGGEMEASVECYRFTIIGLKLHILSLYTRNRVKTLHILGFLDLQAKVNVLHRLVNNARAQNVNICPI